MKQRMATGEPRWISKWDWEMAVDVYCDGEAIMKDVSGRDDGAEQGGLSRLIEDDLLMLLALAENRIRFSCTDPADHKKDVVQRAIEKLLQAERNRKAKYDDPAKVITAAIWQESVWHSQICRREQQVDFNGLSAQQDEPNAAHPIGRSLSELTLATAYDPTEILIEMLDLKERVAKVSDPDLFIQYWVERWTLEEIARAREWSVMKAQRAVKKLFQELGITDDNGEPSTPAPRSDP